MFFFIITMLAPPVFSKKSLWKAVGDNVRAVLGGEVQTSDGTALGSGGGNDCSDPSSIFCLVEDFVCLATTRCTYNWSQETINSGSVKTTDGTCPVGDEMGYLTYSTQSNTNGGILGRLEPDGTELQGNTTYKARIYIPDLSDGTDTYALCIGSGDWSANTSCDPNGDGVFFLYDTAGTFLTSGSDNWAIVTSGGSTATETTTTTAVADDSWITLSYTTNSDASSVSFFVDGTLVGTHTTNIPTSGEAFSPGAHKIISSAGTTARKYCLSYVSNIVTGMDR